MKGVRTFMVYTLDEKRSKRHVNESKLTEIEFIKKTCENFGYELRNWGIVQGDPDLTIVARHEDLPMVFYDGYRDRFTIRDIKPAPAGMTAAEALEYSKKIQNAAELVNSLECIDIRAAVK